MAFNVATLTVPPALGLVATAGDAFALAALRAKLTVARRLAAGGGKRGAVVLRPAVAGAYRMVTLHDVFGFSFTPEQVSPILVIAGEHRQGNAERSGGRAAGVGNRERLGRGLARVQGAVVVGPGRRSSATEMSEGPPAVLASPAARTSNTTETPVATTARRNQPAHCCPPSLPDGCCWLRRAPRILCSVPGIAGLCGSAA